jgi:hypothetical protein
MEKRQYKLYQLDVVDIRGRMSLSDKVEIIDISLGGVAIKADRRLNIGKEYVIRLNDKGSFSIDVKGIVVRSELSGIEPIVGGEAVTVYKAGMVFRDEERKKVLDFLQVIERHKREQPLPPADRRVNLRFTITTPMQQNLNYPEQFSVRTISLSGMLIHAGMTLTVSTKVPMELVLSSGTVKFIGRVASCLTVGTKDQPSYEIGVAFTDLTDEDKKLLRTFIDYLASRETAARKAAKK